jgi:hypothetical protein
VAQLGADLIGPMHETPEPIARIAYAPNDLADAAKAFRRGAAPLTIPPRRRVRGKRRALKPGRHRLVIA